MTAVEIKCPKCGDTRSYRMRRYAPPYGEKRMCEGCWRAFDYQTPEEQARTDQAITANHERKEAALKRVRERIAEDEGKVIPLEEGESVRAN